MKISVISSAFNEEDNVEELYERVKKQFELLGDEYEYEQLVIDNASTDNTLAKLKEIAAKDKRFKIIINARNFGHIRSPYHGILQCYGDAVIYMASDLQDPPELIPEFIKAWHAGNKIVFAQKNKSKESFLFFNLRKIYYKLLNLMNDTGAELVQNCTGFGLYDQEVIQKLRELNEPYPYLRGLVCELGYQKSLVPFEQPLRKRGITKNNFYTLYDNAMIGFINHSKVPLRIAAFLGFVIGTLSFLVGLIYLVLKLIWWDNFSMGVGPIVVGIFFIGAVQLIFLSIIGEYVGTILTHIKKIPPVIEKERINF